MQWRIGCSGYHYKDWKRIFYPDELPEKNWFEFYSSQFNTLELNVTFYRFPKVSSLKSWYERAPENFIFTVKAPRLITHFKKLQDAQVALNNFYETIQEGLKEKAGAVLFQFPATFVYELHRLERLLNLVNPEVNNVIEFRHPSWWIPQVYEAFKARNITFCSMSHPGLPSQVVESSDMVYYRFHGVPDVYISSYDGTELEKVANEIQQYKNVKQAFIYFNNTSHGAALQNARQFQEVCEAVSH